MKTRTALCAALLALAATLTACSSNAKADPAACKAAMTKQFKDGIAAGDNATPGTRPHACDGVDDKTVQKYATEIMKKQIGDAVDKNLKGLETATP
jgi:ABC-type glycerol-3-phosphate transport system substrate-binding protein